MTMLQPDDIPFGDPLDRPPRWQRIQLADDEYAIPPDPPQVLGILYENKRHVVSGAPESAKTLVIYTLLLHALRDGHPVAIVDFEMGPNAARILLTELGATRDEIRSIYYVEPDQPPTDQDIAELVDHGTRYALIDAAAGAYDATGLDDNLRKDVEAFARRWIRPLRQHRISTIVIDHVAKNTETRGKWAIGSERKGGQADVHLGLEAVKTLTRGGDGLVKVTVHKDRPGFLPRPTVCLFELHSDPETHHITWKLKPHDEADPDTGELRPTILMEIVSRFLEEQHGEVSRNTVETTVKGKSAKWKRTALDTLIREGYVNEFTGSRSARMVTSIKPYRQATDPKVLEAETVTSDVTSSDLVSPRLPHEQADSEHAGSSQTSHIGVTSSQNPDLTSSDLVRPRPDEVTPPRPTSSPSTEGTRRGDAPQTTSPRPDQYDAQDQALIDYYESLATADQADSVLDDDDDNLPL